MMLSDSFSAVEKLGDQYRTTRIVQAEPGDNLRDAAKRGVAGGEPVAFRLGLQGAKGFGFPLPNLLYKVALSTLLRNPEVAIAAGNLRDFHALVHYGV
jgi:hypothetical protein